ncbi:PQQ-dependent sugar dehydrogenase [Actinophytocola sp.]|uniref:PQQ-dependent sugar dehydrogenase n=1 Tax=Actinophytocola sp. TaxID=1872138 RepID=UPI002D80FF16|nr:PQQ-dependent sugar dehydrogenase [Actinophytocola sp.]HET9137912.1 PQQ-dependent sugar dehydrogenase [Actinophytocola sp.]
MARSSTPRRTRLGAAAALLLPALVIPLADAPVAGAAVPPDSRFQKVALDTNTTNPMALDVAPDGRVFYVDRLGDVRIIQPAGGTVLAAHLNVFTANESGLLNLALDPAFASNHFIYLYHSPAATSVDRLSRFTITGNTLDLASERVVLDVPVQRAECCHHGAGLVFDKTSGNLWLSTGDNTNPFDSNGYTPIDERAGRSSWDAQRTAGNTNSLSGKILRIHPQPDGSYTIPAGNLFAPGTANARPEIYQMGERNPFRMGIDPRTGFPVVANFGPDAGSASSTRGPQNTVEWDVISRPGNAGWPHCIGPNLAYNDFDFATAASGPPFDCTGGPANNSPNNTGQTRLPPAIPAQVYYHYAADPAHFPQLSGGGPIAGPVYRFDASLSSSRKWPVELDGRAVFGEWTSNRLFAFQLDAAGTAVTAIDQMLSSMTFLKPMDFKFGPDGALYLIEWGSGFGGDNTDSQIDRIDYLNGAAGPTAKAGANRTNGPAPLAVTFSSAGSSDPSGGSLTFSWNFGDGSTSTAANPSHTFAAGNHTVVLTVRNAAGATGTASLQITSGNTIPTVTISAPPTGGLFDFGESVTVTVSASDPEDGAIDCSRVSIQAILGHDSHGHPLNQYTGCSARVQTTLSAGHGENDNLFYVIEASYTDRGGTGGSNPLTGRGQVTLQPKHKQAEFFTATGRTADGRGNDTPGVTVEAASEGGSSAAFIQDGDWFSFDPLALNNITGLTVRASSASAGGTVEVRRNSPTGTLVASVAVTATGGWQTWRDFSVALSNPPAGTGTLYLVARNPAGATGPGFLFNVNWVMFAGAGVGLPPVNRVISLRARANNNFVTAENAGAGALIANRAAIGNWEQFDLVNNTDGGVSLRAHANNMFVTAENAGTSPLVANRATVGPWEEFDLVNNANGSVSLRAHANNMFVCADNAGANPLIANRAAIGAWEQFDLIG